MMLTIKRRMPSLNVWQRMHWAARRREKQAWHLLVLHSRGVTGGMSGYGSLKRDVIIKSYRNKLCDPDNLVAACKPVNDALVKCGVIVDDSPEWITLAVFQFVCARKDERTEIEITEGGLT